MPAIILYDITTANVYLILSDAEIESCPVTGRFKKYTIIFREIFFKKYELSVSA